MSTGSSAYTSSSSTGTSRDTGGSMGTGGSVDTSSSSTGTSTGTGSSTSTSSVSTGTSSSTATSAGGAHTGGSADTGSSGTGTGTDTSDTSGSMDTSGSGMDPHGSVATGGSGMNTGGNMDTGGSGTSTSGSGMSTGGSTATSSSSMNTGGSMATSSSGTSTSGSGMSTGGSTAPSSSGTNTGGNIDTSSSSMSTSASTATSSSSTSTGGSMDTGGSGTSTSGSGMSTSGSMAPSSSSMNTGGNMATSSSGTSTGGSMATSSNSMNTGGSMDTGGSGTSTGGSGMSTGGSMATSSSSMNTSGSGMNTGGTTTTDGTDEAEWAACLPPGALSALRYRPGSLSILDQRLLPAEVRYEAVRDVERARGAIASMEVRGAPAIALVGCLALAVELRAGGGPSGPGGGPSVSEGGSAAALAAFVDERLRRLEGARPTGSNMQREAQRLRDMVRGRLQERPPPGEAQLRESIIEHLEGLLRRDVAQNRSIGAHGARHILGRVPPGSAVTLLTHCNTGGLATAGYGTALGIVWALHAQGRVARVFCTETRPCNQGARLTALELLRAGVPATLITDSAAATAIRDRGVQAVVVGADRVAANGDTANKVGTYPLALAARQHRVPLYVAAPSASCDPALPSGGHLPLEERPGSELGAAPGIDVWNPAFDVTPHELITGGIVTEWGVFAPSQLRAALQAHGAL